MTLHYTVTSPILLVGILSSMSFTCSCAQKRASEVSPARFCEMKLESLSRAIKQYRAANGNLPPTTTSAEGIKHSWRVLVAPFLIAQLDNPGEFDYRFQESWNSPHNRRVFQKSLLTSHLTCPTESQSLSYPYTSYVMLLRNDSDHLDDNKSVHASLPQDAVLIIESTDCRIEYGEPRDIDLASLFENDSPFGVGKLNSHHPSVVRAIRVDGKVIDIPKQIDKASLRQLLAGTVQRTVTP